MKEARVDGAAQQAHVAEPVRFEKRGQLRGRHQRRIGAIVEAAQVRVDDRRQESETVMARVIVETRVEASADWNAEPSRGAERSQTERTFGCDIENVGPLRFPAPV